MTARKTLGILAVSASLFCSTASALTVNTVGQSFQLSWNGTFDGATLTANAVFTLLALDADATGSAQFSVVVNNTTAAAQVGTNRLVSFGIGTVNPDLIGASIVNNAGGETWATSLNTNFPGFQRIDLCIWAGNNCSGGANQGLLEGQSDSFTLNLFGNFSGGFMEFLAPATSRWQSVGISGESVTFGGNVPEPGPLALFGLGLAGLAFRQRRKAL